MAAFASNADLFASGADPVFHPIFMTLAIAFLGGTGNTFGLCVLSLRAKSLYWLVCSMGFVTAPYLMISGTYPIFLSIFIFCLDWGVQVFVALMIPLTMVVWYPFFKTYDNQLYRQEMKEKEAEL